MVTRGRKGMEWWMWLIAGGILFYWAISAMARTRIDARRQYQDALAALESDPTNAALRKAALEKGRVMSGLFRGLRGDANSSDANVALHEEARVRNDIDAVSTLSSGHALSYADELGKLAALQKDGVISMQEFDNLKDRLASKPSNVQDVIRLLRGLKELKNEGVLTPGEFDMKKWDILSKRILND
jgi:hypothetical protein